MSAEQNKPRFEPPPWEREAFERFERERQEAQAREELESALKSIREPVAPTVDASGQADSAASAPDPQSVPDGPAVVAGSVPADLAAAGQDAARPSESQIDSMLLELRGEEGPAAAPNKTLISVAMGLLSVGGLATVIQAARLFAQSRGAGGASVMFAGTVSLLMTVFGFAALGAAYLLFRKYYR